MIDNANKQAVIDAIWGDPAIIFGCQFKGGGRRWDSRGTAEAFALLMNADGTNIYVQFNHGHPLAGTRALDVITYLENHVLKTAEFVDTLKAIAEAYNITLNFSAEQKQAITRAALAREVAASLVEALRLNPEGSTAQYLRNVRGMEPDTVHFGELTAESIRAAKDSLNRRGVRYTEQEFNNLFVSGEAIRDKNRTAEDVASWGYNLVLPYYHNGQVRGFVLRNTSKESKGPKYLYSEGIGRTGYCDLLEVGKPAVIVEGQMDAIRLMQAGVANVIAMGGAKISDDMAKMLRARNINQVTYIPDLEFNEDGTQKVAIISDAIKAFQAARVDGEPVVTNLYVGELSAPQGMTAEAWKQEITRNGNKIDADDYGKKYGKNELLCTVMDAMPSWDWELQQLTQWGFAQGDDINIAECQKRFNDIYTRTANPYERDRIKREIRNDKYKAILEQFGITPEALESVDELERNNDYNNRLKALQDELNTAVGKGANQAVIADIVARLGELQGTNTRAEWERQLNESFADELEAIRNQPETLKTKWELGNLNPMGQFIRYGNIEYWPADIAVIAAESSHGKTMFMFQSVFDMLRMYPDKTFIYVSCEENKRQLLERALNVYLDIPTTANGIRVDESGKPMKDPSGKPSYCFISQTRKKTIKAVIRGTDAPLEYSGLASLEANAESNRHYASLSKQITDGIARYEREIRPRLKMVHTDGTAESITANVMHYVDKFRAEGIEVGGVFVDYMQLLTSDGKNYSRHDEIKDICKALKTCAATTELPIVIAAQLNREGLKNGIDSITLANLGEGADIERIAHDVYFVWQVDKTKRDTYFTWEYPKKEGTRNRDENQEPTQVWNAKVAGDRANRIFTHNELNPRARELKKGYMYVEQMKARDGRTEGWALYPYDGERGYIGEIDKAAMKA